MGVWDDIEVHGAIPNYGYQGGDVAGLDRTEILGALYDVLGENSGAMMKNPAFQQALARKLAQRAPTTKSVPPTKKRRWVVGFQGTGAAGTVVNIQNQPQQLFRGEKLIITDNPAGTTLITGIFIGNLPQGVVLNTPVLSTTFGPGTLDNEMLFDTCQPAQFIQFSVSFTVAGTWNASLIGHAVQG